MFDSHCFLLRLFLVLALVGVVALETEDHGDKTDPYFQYGTTQAVVALVVILASLATTVVTLILAQRLATAPGRPGRPTTGPTHHQTRLN